ncbi:MAG TPA: alpha/beta hydrolase [Acidimicrobiia bacterium]|nr:alpha/beta hydrolase [Acidimicrobiia bacterium]
MTVAPARRPQRTATDGPPLPRGRRIELGGRGTTFVREVDGPPGAPTLLLLHGWLASGGLNWFTAFDDLARHFRVVAPDVRGHARGLRSRRIFRLADCADDCAETLVELGTGPVIAVGYSMGGPIAQLFWQRHRDLCAGLVLCATAGGFMPGTRERLASQAVMAAVAGTTRVGSLLTRLPGAPPVAFPFGRAASMPAWAAAEMRRHDLRLVIEAGHSISTYHARWLPDVDVPTAAVVTTHDRAVAPRLQYEMAAAIPHATVHPIFDGHLACARPSFAAPLRRACLDVATRAFG